MNDDLSALLARQKAAQSSEGPPSAAVRIDRIDRCIDLLVSYRIAIEEALNADFGVRSREGTALTDIASSIAALKHAKANLHVWMRPERRRTSPAVLAFLGARAEVRFQPKGVVGLISPWNFPINLTFGPLAGVLAAGNRAMIKPSEFTPATSALMKRIVATAFAPEEIAVVTGGADIGQAFAALPFDHLVFTGAASVARQVMRAAAENLTPLTLELGGKSPVIIGRSANLEVAASRIMNGKLLNAGQICLAPDYVLAPREEVEAFAEAATSAVVKMFPTLKDNPDYTSVINQRRYDRLIDHLREAREAGARVIEINPAKEDFSQQPHRKIPPTLILDPPETLAVMQEEIFGPILPVVAYDDISSAIARVNAGPRPLGLYWFGEDDGERERVASTTVSGGFAVNDVVVQVAHEDLPFGGIGASGMGAYHGRDGFREFSHSRAVYFQLKAELPQLVAMRPPWGEAIRKYLAGAITR